MRFDLTATPIDDNAHDDALRIVSLHAREAGATAAMGAAAAKLDHAHSGTLQALIRHRRCLATPGDMRVAALPASNHAGPVDVLLVGIGQTDADHNDAQRSALNAVASAIAKRVSAEGPARAVVAIDDFITPKRDASQVLETLVLAFNAATYVYDTHHTEHEQHPKRSALEHIVLQTTQTEQLDTLKQALNRATALAAGLDRARNIGNAPPNFCFPQTLAEHALELSARHPRLEVEVLDEQALEKLGANAILAVGRGSARPPRLIRMTWRGGEGRPIALVGKGITFDTGGISLKPGPEMDEMKYDLGGAAAVLGAFDAIAQMDLPLHVVGVIAAAENMPDGNATRPGDIITTLSGRTVEILNTDAEGRLVLCDALTYTERFEPECIIDLATLTGACIIALGHQASALLANDDDLANEILAAAETSSDRAWRLPLWPEYGEQLKSNFADLANIGGRPAGTITAAYFLSRFAQKQRWAHLDIAGVAWKSGKEKGATGRPVPLLVEFLTQRAKRDADTAREGL
ncbi:MAG: leucyl aminopeptidase [Thioalkalivibrionaceae bacterium]